MNAWFLEGKEGHGSKDKIHEMKLVNKLRKLVVGLPRKLV